MNIKKNVFIYILILLFVIWSVLINTDFLTVFDNSIYNFLMTFKSDNLTKIMKLITNLASTKSIILLCLLSLISFIWKNNKSIYLIICIIVSTLANLLVKAIIARPRPDFLKMVIETTTSYPSGHSQASFCFWGFIIYTIFNSKINKYLKIFLISILSLLIFLTGTSRVYLGVHYPSDVIGGYLLALIVLSILITIFKKKRMV